MHLFLGGASSVGLYLWALSRNNPQCVYWFRSLLGVGGVGGSQIALGTVKFLVKFLKFILLTLADKNVQLSIVRYIIPTAFTGTIHFSCLWASLDVKVDSDIY